MGFGNASDNHTQNFPHTTKARNAKTSFPKTHNNNLRKIYTLPYFLHLATMKLRGKERGEDGEEVPLIEGETMSRNSRLEILDLEAGLMRELPLMFVD